MNASRDGYEVKGDVKINGTPADLDFRKTDGRADGDLRLHDQRSMRPRARGSVWTSAPTVTGAIPHDGHRQRTGGKRLTSA